MPRSRGERRLARGTCLAGLLLTAACTAPREALRLRRASDREAVEAALAGVALPVGVAVTLVRGRAFP